MDEDKKTGRFRASDDGIDESSTVSYDDDIDSDADMGGTSEERIAKLKDALRKAKAERTTYLDGWQRANADFANLKKRTAEEMAEFRKFARVGLLEDLLPVLDAFGHAMANKEVWEKVDENWRKGIEYINAQIRKTLSEHGLEECRPEVGSPFTPSDHTAVSMVHTDDAAKDHTIASVIQSGYKVEGKVIRPAQVTVYDATTPTTG